MTPDACPHYGHCWIESQAHEPRNSGKLGCQGAGGYRHSFPRSANAHQVKQSLVLPPVVLEPAVS